MGSSSGGTLETRPGEGDQGSSEPAAPAPAGEAKPQKNQDRLVTGPAGPGSPASRVEGSMWSPGPCPLVCLIEQPPVWPHHTGSKAGVQAWAPGFWTFLRVPGCSRAERPWPSRPRVRTAWHVACAREMTAAAGGVILDLGVSGYRAPY